MKYQAKVKTVEKHQDSQGEHLVCRGKYIQVEVQPNQKVGANWFTQGDKYYIPLIISETEKPEEGDYVVDLRPLQYGKIHRIIGCSKSKGYEHCVKTENGIILDPKDQCFKILALPENFSPKHLQARLEGKIKPNDEILVGCEEKYFNGSGYYSPEQLSKEQREFYGLMKMSFIKLNQNNHIKLFRVDQKDLSKGLYADCENQHFKYFYEGYRECVLVKLHGLQAVEDMGIDFHRYSPDSARRFSYDKGWEQADSDYKQKDSWSIKEVLSDLIKAIRYEHDTENLDDLELIANRFLENLPQSNSEPTEQETKSYLEKAFNAGMAFRDKFEEGAFDTTKWSDNPKQLDFDKWYKQQLKG